MNLNGKKILVTGGTGFLGKHVTKELEDRGAISISIGHEVNLMNTFNVAWYFSNLQRLDAVVHLAANVGGIGYNQKFGVELFTDNMTMGMNILRAAHQFHVNKTMIIGTACAYPKRSIDMREEELWEGFPEQTNAPYGIAKRAIITLGQTYRKQYDMNVVSVIPTNLYGPGDNFHPEHSHVIPALIRKVYEAKRDGVKQIQVWGTGLATRDFLYVKDAAKGIVDALEMYDDAEPVNLGSGKEIQIRQVAETIQKIFDWDCEFKWDHTRPDGQPRRFINIDKAVERLNWAPKTEMEDGLKETIEWYVGTQK